MRTWPALVVVILGVACVSACAAEWRIALADTFDGGALDAGAWVSYPPEAGLPGFPARDGGRAVYLRTERGNRGLASLLRPLAPYRLTLDFCQPAAEAGGYALVIHHAGQGGETWWFEFMDGGYAVWTTYLGGWAPRWTGTGLKTGTWYRLLVECEAERVRVTVGSAQSNQPVAQSNWLPHDDLGEPNGLVLEAASGGGLRGCLFDNVSLEVPTAAALHRVTTPVDAALHAALLPLPRVGRSSSFAIPPASSSASGVGEAGASPHAGGAGEAGASPRTETLTLELDDNASARSLRIGERSLSPPGDCTWGGFYAVDVAASSRLQSAPISASSYHRFTGALTADGADLSCPDLGLSLRARFTPEPGRLSVTGTLRDETGSDRAIVLYYVLPLDATGLRWGDSLNDCREIGETGRYHSNTTYGQAGASGRHLVAPYPWASLCSDRVGFMVARPLDWPRLMSWSYDHTPDRRCLVIRTELGLSPLTRKFPSRADFRFALSPVPSPRWNMRAAAQRYYDLYPELFTRRVKTEGLWHLWVTPQVEHPEDFALVFHEQEPYSPDRVAFDERHGGLSLTYAEPNALWLRFSDYREGKAPPEVLLRTLKERAAQARSVTTDYPFSTQPRPLPECELAQAALNSYLGTEGEPVVYPAPPDRVCLNMNSDPELPRPNRASLYLDYEAKPALTDPQVDGAYLDSLGWGAFDAAEGFRKQQWATADLPLVPSFRAGAPAQLAEFTHNELYAEVARLMHARGKLVIANTFPSNHLFTAHLLDILGAGEGGDLGAFHEVRQLSFCRALAYRKPLSHMNYAYFSPAVPLAEKERALQRTLLYDAWPGSGNVAAPAQLEPLRPLYRRYMPLFAALAQAGWQPVTEATVTEPAVVERYGAPPPPASSAFAPAVTARSASAASVTARSATIAGPRSSRLGAAPSAPAGTEAAASRPVGTGPLTTADCPLYLVVHNPSAEPLHARLRLQGALRRAAWQPQVTDAVTGRKLLLDHGRMELDLSPWQTVMLTLTPSA